VSFETYYGKSQKKKKCSKKICQRKSGFFKEEKIDKKEKERQNEKIKIKE